MNIGPLIIITLIGLAINAGYFIYTWVAMRGTVGMRVLGMQLGHEQDGRTITYQQGSSAGCCWVHRSASPSCSTRGRDSVS